MHRPSPVLRSTVAQVKAQIKLRFTSAIGKPAVCTRSFSLTQKPQKRECVAAPPTEPSLVARGLLARRRGAEPPLPDACVLRRSGRRA
jgi:hypothetical protein